MLKLVKCEFWKLKRKKFIPLVILSAFLFPVPLTYLMTTPSMMERYTDKADAFDGLFNMVLGYGIQFLLPCIIGIIAAIIFGLICSLFTIIAELLVGFPGFRVTLALKSILQITAVNFFLYLAVLPIIVITCRKAGSFLVGVIIAFVYGYGGMFAAGNMTLANIYPITASLGMVGYRNYDTAVHWNIIACMCSLAFVVIISAVFILCTKETEPQKAKKKAKKVIAKKGW